LRRRFDFFFMFDVSPQRITQRAILGGHHLDEPARSPYSPAPALTLETRHV
jgi:hypothetical protein